MDMLGWIAGVVLRRSRLILVISGLFVVAAGVLATGAMGKVKVGGYLDESSESSAAAERIDSRFGGQYNLLFLVKPNTGALDSPEVLAEGKRLTEALAGETALSNVISYFAAVPALRSGDGSSALIAAHVAGDEDTSLKNTQALYDKYHATDGPVSVRLGGVQGVARDVYEEVQRSLIIAESIAVPVTLVLLVLAFGSVVAALLPLVIGLLAIVGTFGEIALLGGVTDVSIFAVNLTTALGLGLGIDYALFMVARFRERLTAGDTVADAVATTVRTSGRTILFSAFTVAAALAAMAVFPLFYLRSLAFAGVGVVVIAALACLFVIPALLNLLGHRVNAVKLPWSKSLRGSDAPFWGKLAAGVARRPLRAVIPVVLVLLFLAVPILHAQFGNVDDRVLPASTESRSANDTVRHSFDGFTASAVDVVVEGRMDETAVARYAGQISAMPGVAGVQSSAGAFVQGNAVAKLPTDAVRGKPDAQWLSVASSHEPKSDATLDFVKSLRALPDPPSTTVLVGGTDAELIDTQHAIGDRLPWAIAIIVLITFIVLFLFTGSVLQPVRALILNGVSMAATFGIVVWGFQDGHLAGMFGFTAQPVDTAITVLIFCVVFGVSMDYEVFLISRVKELHDSGASNAEALRLGMARTGRIVSAAAGMLAVVFFSFLTSSISFLQLFGVAAGVAILIDAILVRGVLVPGALALMGRTAWWSPPFLRRLHERVGVKE
nr:Integral membrane protein [Kibdelosporangium sp. MJ126-NF4]